MKKLFYFLTTVLVASFAACSSDDVVDFGTLSVSSEVVTFNENGGTFFINTNAESGVNASIADGASWLTVGIDGKKVLFTASELIGDSRTAEVTVSAVGYSNSVKISISQTPNFSTQETELEFAKEAGSKDVSFYPSSSTVTWDSNMEWATVTIANGKATISVTANESVFVRNAVVTLTTDKQETVNIKVAQLGSGVESLTWTPWANGTYRELNHEKATVVSKAEGMNLFRIESPYVEGYHNYFEWKIDTKDIALQPMADITADIYGEMFPVQFTGRELEDGYPEAWICCNPFILPMLGMYLSFYNVETKTLELESYLVGWSADEDPIDLISKYFGGTSGTNYFEITEFLQGNP